MRPTGAAHTVIATPELAFLLFAHLTPHDRVQCIQVCKAWSRHLEPIHWTNFCPTSFVDSKGLIRNLPFIRTVEINTDRIFAPMSELAHGLPEDPESSESAILPNTPCTNLRRFKLQSLHARLGLLPKLLNHNRFLTHLTFPDITLELETLRLPAAISRLRHLQHLAIVRFKIQRQNQPTLALLQACLPLPDLTELIMDFDVLWHDKAANIEDHNRPSKLEKDRVCLDLDTIIKESSVARFSQNPSASKIKLLHLPVCREDEDDNNRKNPLLVPLLTSGLLDLKSCTIPWVSKCATSLDVEKVVREYSPNLKHLTYQSSEDEYEDEIEDEEFVRAFIRGCSGLESFTLSNLGSQDRYRPAQLIISDLVSHHYNTLKEIELTDCWRLSGSDQQAILERCKQLRRFWVTSAYQAGSTGIRLTDTPESMWVCMELRELRLKLNRLLIVDEDDDDSDSEDEEQDDIDEDGVNLIRVFTQIGRLSKLEKLRLDIDRSQDTYAWEDDYQLELMLFYGQLEKLAGLKNLRSLTLEAYLCSRMGKAQVKFMHEHWPLLEEIVLSGIVLSGIVLSGDVSRLRRLSHWKWLLNKRPQLRIIKHD